MAPDPASAPHPGSFLLSQTILGGIRDEDDEILPRKDYEARTQVLML